MTAIPDLPLGPLQIQAMHIIWDLGTTTVQAVWIKMNEARSKRNEPDLAYTTILTVMRNMVARGFLKQERAMARAHTFTATISRQEYAKHAAETLVLDVFKGDRKAAIAVLQGAA